MKGSFKIKFLTLVEPEFVCQLLKKILYANYIITACLWEP